MSFLGCIGEVNRAFTLHRASQLEAYEIYGPQSLYISRICRSPGMSQEELAKKLLFNKSSVARQVAALEEKGFLRRERSREDRRVLLIYPTEKAEKILPLIRESFLSFMQIISEDLTEEEVETLTELTQKIDRRAREAVKDL